MINKLLLTIKSPKTLIAVTMLSVFSSTALYAHDSCDVDLKAGLTINESKLEFFEPKKKEKVLYVIDKQYNLTVAGKKIALNSEQQALVKQYSTNIRKIVPQVRLIAIEGVDLALAGVDLAFNQLLGEGNEVGADLTQELSSLKAEVAERFTIENGFTIGEDGVEDDELFGADIEQRIESAVEKAVMNSMGNLLVALGQEMMLSGGDSNDFETRMENFGETIEYEMKSGAEKIERKADSLCVAAIEIDQLEEKLRSNIPSLADINVITVNTVKIDDKPEKKLM